MLYIAHLQDIAFDQKLSRKKRKQNSDNPPGFLYHAAGYAQNFFQCESTLG